MSDLRADCDWHDGTLFLVLPEDPERIAVRLFPSRQASSRMYVPEEEVVKLREQVAEACMQLGGAWVRCTELRECLQDLAEHIREDDGFGLDYGWMLDRMRELGVEVDGWESN